MPTMPTQPTLPIQPIAPMTRRQRVLAAIDHRPTDRMPIDLGVHFSSGISVFAYRRLREHLGLSVDRIEIVDTVQMLARVDEDILERFHCDAILLNPVPRRLRPWTIRDGETFLVSQRFRPERNARGEWVVTDGARRMRMPEGGYFFDGDWLACSEYDTEEEELSAYAARAESLYKETDYATFQLGFPAFFGDVEFACDILTDPDRVLEQQEAGLAYWLARTGRVIDRYGPYIQGIVIAGDMGTQSGPYVSREHFDTFTLPYLQKYCRFVHENSDLRIHLHSCGSIAPLIPSLVEAGVDILNPVQISAANMDPTDLKQRFGDKMCFWGGGCDTQNVLPWATPEAVRDHVRSLVGIFRPGGGFVFNQVHNIMGNIPPENVVAMLDAAFEAGS